MECFNCGAELSRTDYCPHCGVEVKLYRRMIQLSNAYYNEGLDKAKVRDLSGAVISLRQSLKISKRNTNARNLLGLVYFEMGEVVDALSQWILSRSFQKEGNLAEEYIQSVQDNQARLATINTTIKKYNQSLIYCEQESYDLAVIQLKKILSTNPNLLKGHQLLALLYMKMDNYERARVELERVLDIDRTNTRALRYLKELDTAEGRTDRRRPRPVKEQEENRDAIAYTSGNETIIQPIGMKDYSWLQAVLNVVIGIAIGVAVMWFLIMPAQQQMTNSELNDAVAEYSSQLESRTAALASLQTELDTVKSESEIAIAAAAEAASKIDLYEGLLEAYRSYTEEDMKGALDQIESLDKETLPEDAKVLYDSIFQEVGTAAVDELYKSGYDLYQKREYEAAITDLLRCYQLDETNGDAAYFLARSYHGAGDTVNAKIYYQIVINGWPNTKKATDAAKFMEGL